MGDSIDNLRIKIKVTIANRERAIALSNELIHAGLQIGKDFPPYKDTRYISLINNLESFIKAEMEDIEVMEKALKESLKPQ